MISYILRKLSGRNEERLRIHYEVERSIAEKLKHANKEERKAIYHTMYDELFKKIPDHSRLNRRKSPVKSKKAVELNYRFLKKHLKNVNSFMEFAPGDGKLAVKIAEKIPEVFAVDISNQLDKNEEVPENMKLIIYDGYQLNHPTESVNLVFSNQLIEHFHPEETLEHFNLVYSLLKPSGTYIFKTPHRYSGPWDISRYFSNEPEGFHLKEWTYNELIKLARETGFKNIVTYFYPKFFFFSLPIWYFKIVEKTLLIFPKGLRRVVSLFFTPHIAMLVKK